MLRRIKPTESQIQCAIMEWANNTFVDHPLSGKTCIGSYLIKIPNEGKRSFHQGKKMKKEGLKKGVSDLFLSFPSKQGFNGFWIELKRKGKQPTQDQLDFLVRMIKVGYRADCLYSVEEGIHAIKDYLGMR